MPAHTIDGKAVSDRRRVQLASQVQALVARSIQPCLAAVTVRPDHGWSVYLKNQATACASVGIRHRIVELGPGTNQDDLSEAIEELNVDAAVHGIILQSPLNAAGSSDLSELQAQAQLSPDKDVEGVNPANLGLLLAGRPALAPCTALSAFALAQDGFAAIGRSDLIGVEACVVGASLIVGKPIAQLLLAAGATVTTCHIHTRDLAAHTRTADLLIVAVGKAGLIQAGHVKPGAVVVDVGINRIAGRDGKAETVGDVAAEAASVAAAMTPVPGGVGSLTTTILLESTVSAAQRLSESNQLIDAGLLARIVGGSDLNLPRGAAERIAMLLSRHLVAVPGAKPLRSPLERRLAQGVLVLDGAMGTELIARGIAPADVARANLDHPDLVLAIHRAYVDAGAQVITANTFSANRHRTTGGREAAVRQVTAGVQLARQAASSSQGRPVFVLGSIGPLGRVVGADCSSADAEDVFAEVALAMVDANVDGFAIETMPSTAEASAALAAVRRVSRLPVLVCRSIERADPLELGEFARAMEAGGASAIGINCAAGPRALAPVASALAGLTRLPVVARPNAGFPTSQDGRLRYHLRPDYLVERMREYVAAGVSVIGGCCGIGPEHIRAVAAAFAGAPIPARPAQQSAEGVPAMRSAPPVR
ncbi:MAG: homocysteine S-methyltransferase family protein, partial [Planctomycetes bacterium]|nr:homocysteine S-methyltransferase family protein [Planctomycetota bacterium]